MIGGTCTTKQKPNLVNLFRENSQDFHALFTRFSQPKLRVFSWVQPMNIPLKSRENTLKNSQLMAHETV